MIKDFEQVSLTISQGHPLYDKIISNQLLTVFTSKKKGAYYF